uniref:hypothetical protein n=1 Tax=Pedobacter heparinus TaxID=984 RepID=UPI00292FF04E
LINVTYLDRAFEGYEHNITLLGRQDRNEENPYRYQFEDYYTKARIPADFRPTNMVNKFRSDRTLSGMRGYFKYKKITTENRSFGIKIEVLQDGKLYKTYFLNNNPTGGYSNYAPEGVLEIAIY